MYRRGKMLLLRLGYKQFLYNDLNLIYFYNQLIIQYHSYNFYSIFSFLFYFSYKFVYYFVYFTKLAYSCLFFNSYFVGFITITSTYVYATYFLWYLLNLFFKGNLTYIITYILYPLSVQYLSMYFLVDDLCIEQIFPSHIFIANQRNIISIPAYFVPQGGFITTRSTGRLMETYLNLLSLILAKIRS